MKKNEKEANLKLIAEERKYFITYITRYGHHGRTNVWKENPKGLVNVWLRKATTDYSGSKFVIGYTIREDGILSSHTKPLNTTIRFLRRIRLRNELA